MRRRGTVDGIIGGVIFTEEDWRQLWHDVGARLATERAAGRGHLMTEDVVRYQTVLALEHFGVAPARRHRPRPLRAGRQGHQIK
jgi:hypothetical protein